MPCCNSLVEPIADLTDHRAVAASEEIVLASHALGDGSYRTNLSVPGMRCGACMRAVEKGLLAVDGVESARVNLSTKRVAIRWRSDGASPPLIEALARLGYEAHLFEETFAEKDVEMTRLLRALAVAGFAAGNIMLLSVSVWSGAEPATRDLFHWLSAAIAMPALAYCGRIFFKSAWNALRHGRTNMDVPISLGVILTFGLSLYDTAHHSQHTYFDASVTLLLFLLAGRTLDHVMREKARTAVKGLAQLSPRGTTVVHADGSTRYLPVAEIVPGMKLRLSAGERMPVDGRIEAGTSDIDSSIVTGESTPQPGAIGMMVRAGSLNLNGPLWVRATASADQSFLAEMLGLMEAAEGGRARYRRIADRAAALYAPVVHLAALFSFVGWMLIDGGWHKAITTAIAVLLITCPCALGLAVPMVQVVAARRLFENGILVKDGSAMERLAEVDTVLFDKTGTLTLGEPRLVGGSAMEDEVRTLAAAIAAHSHHPQSRAIAASNDARSDIAFEDITERPGSGIEARVGHVVYRLGRAAWAMDGSDGADETMGGTVLSRDGEPLARFAFADRLRPGATATVEAIKRAGLSVELVSGDNAVAVAAVTPGFRFDRCHSGVLPGGKVDRIAELTSQGKRVLMVGDGLNDAPALAAAHVSIAPATAADIGRNAADFVFLQKDLGAVTFAMEVARKARRLVRQNLALAIAYNIVAVPIAVLGLVTPLLAAVAMSLSSIIVVANALRVNGGALHRRRQRPAAASPMAPAALEPVAQ